MKEEAMNIYPNPASVNIHIQMPQTEEPYHQFQLLDAFGRILRTWSTKTATSYNVSIKDLPNGSYIRSLSKAIALIFHIDF